MDIASSWPSEGGVAVATCVAAGLAAGLLWYAFARARGLGRGMCFLTSLVPATVARAALPSQDVLPFVDAFAKVDLQTPYALVEAWSAFGLAGPVAGALLGCSFGWLVERMRRSRAEPTPAEGSPRIDEWAEILATVLVAFAVTGFTAYQRFLFGYVLYSCRHVGVTSYWFPMQEGLTEHPRLDALAQLIAHPGDAPPSGALRAVGCVILLCGLAYPILRRGGRGRPRLVWVVGVATCASVVAGFVSLHRALTPLLSPDEDNLNRLGSMTFVLTATCLVGCLGCAFLGFVRRTASLAGAAPWIVGFLLFCIELRFALESMTNTDRLFRIDVDMVLVRFWPERAMVLASGLSLAVALLPGRAAFRLLALDWKVAARASGLALAVAFVVLTEPYAEDARLFVERDLAPLDGVTAVEQCTRLPDDMEDLSYIERTLHTGAREGFEWFSGDATRQIGLASNLRLGDYGRGARDRRLPLEAAIDTRVGRARGVLQGAAMAQFDVVVVTQRLIALNARTIPGLERREALCDYGTIHLSRDETASPVDPEWTLADAIAASRDEPVRP